MTIEQLRARAAIAELLAYEPFRTAALAFLAADRIHDRAVERSLAAERAYQQARAAGGDTDGLDIMRERADRAVGEADRVAISELSEMGAEIANLAHDLIADADREERAA